MFGLLFGKNRQTAEPRYDYMFAGQVTRSLIIHLGRTGSFHGALNGRLNFSTFQINDDGMEAFKNPEKLVGGLFSSQSGIISFGSINASRLSMISIPPVIKDIAGKAANLKRVNSTKYITQFNVYENVDLLIKCENAEVDPCFEGNSISGANVTLQLVNSETRH